jgi:pseudouridine synthase
MPGWSAQPDDRGAPGVTADAPYRDAARGPRLQKVMAEAGAGSRRACEALIEEGAVEVNGVPITSLPAWVHPVDDVVTVHGARLGAAEAHEYLVVFKPRGVVCTNQDPMGRKRAIDLVGRGTRHRLYPVGRLDVDSSGLLILTNDGELANRLTHPRYGVHKAYEVSIEGALDDAAVRRLERGIWLPERGRRGGRTSDSHVKVLQRDRGRTRLYVQLREGRNRQLRRMLLDIGHKVRRLRRVELGPLRLKGLRPGEWRPLTAEELKALRRGAGLVD